MQQKGRHKIFWRNFKFKYKLSVINENTLEEVFGLRVSKLNGLSVLIFTLFILFLLAGLIMVYTPLRNYLPGYMNSSIRKQVVENELRTDSLLDVVQKQNLYILNVQDIFRGTIKVDSIQALDSLVQIQKDSLMEASQRELEFRKQYEQEEKYNLEAVNLENQKGGLMFFRPTRGIIKTGFNAEKKHFGVDIIANPKESVLATLDGTVILSTYSAKSGYIIQIQHNQDFISTYKHCSALLKSAGDVVSAGEVIALVGETGTDAHASQLHFELWKKGKAVNPEKFIVF